MRAIQRWLRRVEFRALYLEPGSPWENGCAECLRGELRNQFFALEEMASLAAATKLTASWRENYSHHRPHSLLGCVTSVDVAARGTASALKLLSATPRAISQRHRCSETTLVAS